MFDALGYLNGDDGWKDYNNSHSPLYSDYYPSVKILDGKFERAERRNVFHLYE